ncbi:MAG: hypothetical protein IPJ65_36970 [Archangiaceae bacterium]|nr:hypothetical protein [Archangiaceae bacterium]
MPQLERGKTLFTFDPAQLRALHRAYWSAPPTASLEAMARLAFEDLAFEGRAVDGGTVKQVGRVISAMPESFPWGWRSRALAATSHQLVDALLASPEGTPLNQVIDALQREAPGFPSASAVLHAQQSSWSLEPARFPFVERLPLVNGLRQLQGQGPAASPGRLAANGGVALTEALAKKVHQLLQDPRIQYHWGTADYARLIDRELGTAGAFTERTLRNLHARFPRLVPTSHAVHAAAAKRLAENIHRLCANEPPASVQALCAAIEERFGVEMPETRLHLLRRHFPDLIPEFRQPMIDAARADAARLLDEMSAHGLLPTEAGARLGFDATRSLQLAALVRDQREVASVARFTQGELEQLRAFYDRRELGETVRQMYLRVQLEEPELFARHPWATSDTFYNALRAQLELPPVIQQRQTDWAEAFAKVARRSPPGTPMGEMVAVLQDEHAGAYGLCQAMKLLERADQFPALAKLRDSAGAYPWQKGQVELTEALARRVGAEVKRRHYRSHRALATALLRDPDFRRDYPTFNYEHVHHLRARFPKLVPYVDELEVARGESRKTAYRRALHQVALQVEAEAQQLGGAEGITVAGLARRLQLKPHRVLAAVRLEPERFPWYSERPVGEVDLFLATRVAAEMAQAPLSTTLVEVQAALQADERFRRRYPAFNYGTFKRLNERYPDIVPQWSTRRDVYRSKLLVDTMAQGASFAGAVKALSAQHPGQFDGPFSDPGYVKRLWASDPELYAFTRRGAPSPEPAAELADRLSRLEHIPQRLPLLDRLEELGLLKNREVFADYEVLAVQHLLGSQVPLFNALRKLGVKPGRSAIVAIPYSVSPPVADTLLDKGWDVRVPPLDLDVWYRMVKESLQERIAAAKQSGRKVLVLDDGGLTEMIFEKYPEIALDRHLVKVVEQTRRGITVADHVELHEAVINVAQSWGKYVEGPMIGSSLETKAISRLAAIGVSDLKGKKVGVVGAGTIGLPLAEALKAAGATVTVLDLSESARAAAAERGMHVAHDRREFFETQDIVLGTTGVRSMTAEDLALLKDGAIIGSGSSKLVEIDVDALAAMAREKGGRVEVVDAKSHPPTVKYTNAEGRSVTLLARGFPLNFDGSIEDISADRIQLTRGLMLIGALQATGLSAAGIHRLDPDLQLKLLDAFEDVGARGEGPEVVEALDLAKDNLGFLREGHGQLAHDRRHRE